MVGTKSIPELHTIDILAESNAFRNKPTNVAKKDLAMRTTNELRKSMLPEEKMQNLTSITHLNNKSKNVYNNSISIYLKNAGKRGKVTKEFAPNYPNFGERKDKRLGSIGWGLQNQHIH